MTQLVMVTLCHHVMAMSPCHLCHVAMIVSKGMTADAISEGAHCPHYSQNTASTTHRHRRLFLAQIKLLGVVFEVVFLPKIKKNDFVFKILV